MIVTGKGQQLCLRDEKALMGGPREVFIEKKQWQKLTEDQKYRRIWRLRKNYEPKYKNNTEYRRNGKYYAFMKAVSSIYKMTTRQEQYVIDIMDFLFLSEDYDGIQELCRKCDYKKIILALCVHSQGTDKRLINLDKDKFCKEIGLKWGVYNRIRDHLFGIEREAADYYYRHPPVDEKDLGEI